MSADIADSLLLSVPSVLNLANPAAECMQFVVTLLVADATKFPFPLREHLGRQFFGLACGVSRLNPIDGPTLPWRHPTLALNWSRGLLLQLPHSQLLYLSRGQSARIDIESPFLELLPSGSIQNAG
jgi:hypothetical protein